MKRKKSIMGRLAVTAVALTLISTSLMGSTLAKYATETTGSATAVVAKWAFKAGSSEGAEQFTSFKLGETTSSAVVAKERIAPGMTGTVPIYYDLSGTEVKTKLVISIKVDDVSKLPTNFTLKYGSGTEIKKSDLTDDTYRELSSTTFEVDTTTGVLPAATAKGNGNVTWEWGAGTSDASTDATNQADTTDGAAAGTAKFTIKVEAVQQVN